MAIVKDPVTGTMGDIGNQNQAAYQQDVLGAQQRAQSMATSTGNVAQNAINKAPVNPVLNANDVAKVTPMTVTATPQTSGFNSLGGSIEEMTKQYAQTVVDDTKLAQEKQAKDTSLSGLMNKLKGKKGQSQLQDEANAPVDLAKKELNDINNQIIQKQVGNRRAIEEIQKNKERYTGTGMQNAIDRQNRASTAEQADLAVIQMAKNNNYSAAKEIADRKVAAQLEQQKNEYDAAQFDYEENKDQYTKSEQRQFEALQGERKRLLDAEETKLKSINDLAIEAAKNGAPLDVIKAIQGATDINSALVAGAKYMKAPKSGSSSTSSSEFDYAQTILDSNPDVSDEELEVALRQNTKLSDSDIAALIKSNKEKKKRADQKAEDAATAAEEDAPKGSWWGDLVSWGKNLIGK